MLNLLAIEPRSAMFWMLVFLGILLIVEIAVFAILAMHRHKRHEEKPRRSIGITLDTEVVRREYKVGDKFDPSGLIVTARYSDVPFEETLNEFTIVTPELIKKLARSGKSPEDLMGCRIYAPDLSVAGKPTVTVAYQGQIAAYAINVAESAMVEPEPEIVPAEQKAEEAVAEAVVETVNYNITVNAPEGLTAMQVALFNGGNQAGDAVPVINGAACISAVPGDYIVKIFGLQEKYEATVEVVSADNLTATVTVTAKVQEEPKNTVIIYQNKVEAAPVEEPEKAEYVITLEAPEGLPTIQIALFNGDNQIGSAVTVTDNKACITAEPGDYTLKLFGVPENFEVSSEFVSATKHETTVTITEIVVEEEPEIEEVIPTVSEIVDVIEEPELVEYNVIVHSEEELSALQVALFNGDEQIGSAVHVESGAATIPAPEGDYVIKLFGLPEGYEYTAGTVSVSRHIGTITVTAPAPAEPEPAPEPVQEVAATEPSPIVIEEESFVGGILRYDRSFTARLIQADNEVKGWYTEIKNELLSYKKVHDRMSWKRESYNLGRQAFAKLAFRGETLCLYLPLDPESLAESKYKVENAGENASYRDTPCMYRIKNNKRAKYAKELIATSAEFMEALKFEREPEDYYLPYEGLLQLINKGLIKRNIKDKSAEAFFVEKKESNDGIAEEVVEEAVVAEEPVAEEVVEEAVVAEEPVAEEVIEEAVVAEEPVAEEVIEETVVAEEPVAEEVIEEAVVAEEPVAEEVVEETVVAEEPVAEEVIEEAVATEEPVAEEPAEESVAEEPASEVEAETEVTRSKNKFQENYRKKTKRNHKR